jgi:hypothetical protein
MATMEALGIRRAIASLTAAQVSSAVRMRKTP